MSLETLQLMVQPYLTDEGATKVGYLVAPHIGCVCWIGSMIVIALASQRLITSTTPGNTAWQDGSQ